MGCALFILLSFDPDEVFCLHAERKCGTKSTVEAQSQYYFNAYNIVIQ